MQRVGFILTLAILSYKQNSELHSLKLNTTKEQNKMLLKKN